MLIRAGMSAPWVTIPGMDTGIIPYAEVVAAALRAARPVVMAEATRGRHIARHRQYSFGQLLGMSRVFRGPCDPGGLVVVIPDCLKGVKTSVAGMYWHRSGEKPCGVDHFRLLDG